MAGIVAALLLLSIASLWYALQSTGIVTGFVEEPEEVVQADVRERALDGVLVHPSSTRLLPLGVMVENSTDAWPLQGPAKANLVFEAPVEGSITRLLLFFDASTTVAEIGPVRSARPYYVDWAHGLNAFYGHVGGSPDALTQINALAAFRDVNEFYNGWAFWRATNRIAPHNVMTSTDLLLQIAAKKEYTAGTFDPWVYADIATSTDVAVNDLRVPYQGGYAASWKYNADTGLYTRHYANGNIVRDADGTAVTATNVVLLLTDATVLDNIGRLKLRTTGSGSAIVATRGNAREVTWQRRANEHLQFSGIDGTDVPLARGTTWVSVVTNADAFGTILENDEE